MTNKDLSIVTTGDLHLGHAKVPTLHIVEKLRQYFFPYVEKAKLLTINGDIFQSALSLTSVDIKIIISFFISLLELCQKHDVTMRFLRGTSSHDRNQIESLMALYTKSMYTHDLKYFDTLSIEYIDKLDLRMCYIPEDLPYNSSDEIINKIKHLFSDAGWDSCDIILFHGYFEHMLPRGLKKLPKITFNSRQFDGILKDTGYILCNHVHSKSVYKRIIYAGSFDRLAHGEEEAKGFFYIDNNGPHFITNDSAMAFNTIDLSTMTDKDAIVDKYKELVKKKFEDGILGHVRVIHPDISVRQILNKITNLNYPYLKYIHQSGMENNIENGLSDALAVDSYEKIVVTEENLPGMILNFLKDSIDDVTLGLKEITTLLNDM